MFEISWSELLILAIVTLIFVGPKELPVFLRTLGRYAGSIKRQASEFRSQFDDAMREAELDSMKEEVEAMQASVNAEVMSAKSSFERAAAEPAAKPAAVLPPANTTRPPMPAPPRGPETAKR
jgi:sec-independent protein translocase protein TatB